MAEALLDALEGRRAIVTALYLTACFLYGSDGGGGGAGDKYRDRSLEVV